MPAGAPLGMPALGAFRQDGQMDMWTALRTMPTYPLPLLLRLFLILEEI
jgi:hypothetical protein